jgi:cytochrome P450
LEPKIKRITNEMVNEVIQTGRMDLIKDLAYPLPVRIIAELLGLPIEDHDRFKRWADDLVGLAGAGHLEDPAADFSRMLDLRTINEMIFYFSRIIRQRQAAPQDDLITSLVIAEEEGNRLTEQEIIRFCILALLAGHVTTVDLIGNMVLSLLEYPREFKRLQADHSLIVAAVEETLRYRSPVQGVFRFATKDIIIRGQKIQSGQRLILWLGSANHDETVFSPNPDEFDIARNGLVHHLAFGYGTHFCLGAPLARLEGQVVLKTILERKHNVSLDNCRKALEPLPSTVFYGVSHLPLCFESNSRNEV